jgi:hypothetical protein
MKSGAHHAKIYTLCERRFGLLEEILLISDFLVFSCIGASHFSLLHLHLSSGSTAILELSGLVQMYLGNEIARRGRPYLATSRLSGMSIDVLRKTTEIDDIWRT